VLDALGDDEALVRRELDDAAAGAVEVDEEAAVDDVEELVVVVVVVLVVLALHDAEPHDRVVHFAERLVEPRVVDGGDDGRDVDELVRTELEIEMGLVAGVGVGRRHGAGLPVRIGA